MRKLHCESECTLPYTRYILSSCRYFHHSLAWNCTLKINNEEMRESKPNGIPWFGLEERRGFSLRVASSWESIFSWLPIVVLPVDMSSKHIPCAGNCCMYFRPTKRQFAEHEVCYSLNCKKNSFDSSAHATTWYAGRRRMNCLLLSSSLPLSRSLVSLKKTAAMTVCGVRSGYRELTLPKILQRQFLVLAWDIGLGDIRFVSWLTQTHTQLLIFRIEKNHEHRTTARLQGKANKNFEHFQSRQTYGKTKKEPAA